MLKICKKLGAPKKKKEKRSIKNDLLFISFHGDGVYLNEVKVIDKRAFLQIAILKILLEKHLIGNLYLTSTGLNVVKLSNALIAKGISSFDLEKQIRQSIYRIKKGISKNYDDGIGKNFIQLSQASSQYKLDKNVVLVCP